MTKRNARYDIANPRNYKWVVYNIYRPNELDYAFCYRTKAEALWVAKVHNKEEESDNPWAVRESTADERRDMAECWTRWTRLDAQHSA